MSDLLDGHRFVDGRLVSAKIQRLVDSIREYSPELDVKWIPPEIRREHEAAFKIIHQPPGHPPYTIFHVQTEEEFTERVLQRIIAGDQRNGEVTISEIEAWETAQNLIKQQEYLDKLEEMHDIAYHYSKSNKNTYKVNDGLIFKEGSPGNHARDSRKRYL